MPQCTHPIIIQMKSYRAVLGFLQVCWYSGEEKQEAVIAALSALVLAVGCPPPPPPRASPLNSPFLPSFIKVGTAEGKGCGLEFLPSTFGKRGRHAIDT